MTVKTPIAMVVVMLAVLVFAAVPVLAEPVEAPVTEAATEITGTSATLNGELNPNASASTSYEFAYSPYGFCEVFPTAPQGPVTGEKLKVSTHVIELEAHTVYWFCTVALNGADEPVFYAPALTFETLASKPVIPSESATNVHAHDATLEGSVNPENRVTTYRFEYATSKVAVEKAEGTSVGEAPIPAVGEAQPVGPVDLGGVLGPSTTYFYRVVASNIMGVTDGKVEEFTTPALQAPSIDGESATGVAQSTAELHALINPEYRETEYQFKLGTSTAYGVDVPASLTGFGVGEGYFGDLEAGVNVQGELEAQALAPLASNTEYHYEVLAKNAAGTSDGLTTPGIEDKTFLTLPDPPVPSTGEPSAIQTTSATVSGSIDPGSSAVGILSAQGAAQDDTTYYFQYGGTSAYGNQTQLGHAGEGTSAVAETASLQGLEPGRIYHYRIAATNLNDAGELNATEEDVYGGKLAPQVVYGEDKTFETTETPPTLTGVSAQGVTQTGATIVATLDPRNLPSRWELQLGATQDRLQPVASGTTSSTTELSLPVGSLSPGTTYYYKLVATTSNGTLEPEGSFTTAPGPAAVTPPGLPVLIPYQSIAELNAKEAKEDKSLPNPTITRSLTNTEKLKKALKACHAKKNKSRRGTCEKQAETRYGASKQARKGKKK
jgi:hypothetical protein